MSLRNVTRKIINDPVHGFITLDDPLIFQLIAHPYYQRLRRIKQMALAYLVYPGAVHTRLHHSLGAYHLMSKAIQCLRDKGVTITPEEEQAAKIAILLHDIGHGPFSHALEHTLVDVHHEELSRLIMLKLDTIFDGRLKMAYAIFTNQYPKKFLHQLVSSQLDTDRLDYLARDSFFTGVSEGVIGYDRILQMLQVEKDELVVEEKGIHSVENFLIARRLMYWQVYLHKTVLSSELMLVLILQRARELSRGGQVLFATPSLNYFLREEPGADEFRQEEAPLSNFLQLDDADIVASVKVWAHHEDQILADLCTRLKDRRLFKVKFIQDPIETEIDQIYRHVQSNHNYSPEQMKYYLIVDQTSNHAYDAGDEHIRIAFKDGSVQDITAVEHTLISDRLLVPMKKTYICFPGN